MDDPNMSPFNIGVRLELTGFADEQMRELNRRRAGQPCPADEGFYRLRSAGVMVGSIRAEVRLRGELYRRFLARHLL